MTPKPAGEAMVMVPREMFDRILPYITGAEVDDMDGERLRAEIHALLGTPPQAWNSRDEEWQPRETMPTNGAKFDVWCEHPDTGGLGVRFTDVQMRGDGSGFGLITHSERGNAWEYLEREGPVFPKWKITHWRFKPEPPALASRGRE